MTRFVVVESSGYRINLPIHDRDTPNGRLVTEVLVLDRDDCHAVVWSSEHAAVKRERWKGRYHNGFKLAYYRNLPLVERRAAALELAATLNADHRREVRHAAA